MSGYIDLHCHWVPGIDDGVRSATEGVELLRRLRRAGFERVIATPHMRPGMFDNDRATIERSYEAMELLVAEQEGMPEVGLASEHYFDDSVFHRMLSGQGLCYPGSQALLIELNAEFFPLRLADRMIDLRRRKLRPVLAHPERYAAVWSKISVLDEILDAGVVLLMDVAALTGKYGRKPQKAAEALLAEGYYYAACSDAHRPSDVEEVRRGIDRLAALAGDKEAQFLLREGPQNILEGRVRLTWPWIGGAGMTACMAVSNPPLKALLALCVGTSFAGLIALPDATARASFDSPYTLEQTYHTTLRYVRI
ncbi:MAG: CpsB/CapC family capsule biosynthesis tyrosine phosphatase, partial [Myxococcales bacterium]|nr:CpsB/CapC family capsule biosynthesis tyrosine phosphatase [Myxococcales bacterium]